MSIYVKLARGAAEHFVKTQELLPLPESLPSEAYRQQACFVSLFENPGRRLRSMYGEPLPTQPNVATQIIVNTVTAMTAPPVRVVRRADLSYLSYSVALLGPLQRVSDPAHLNPALFGLYVRTPEGKYSVVLPQRVGIETGDDQIGTALREADIDSRREDYTIYRFTVTHYDE